jgi:hypothetical protein
LKDALPLAGAAVDRLMDPVTSLEEGAAATESFGLADLERGGLVFVRSRPFRESRWFFL